MRVPPQNGVRPLRETSPTCHGYSFTSVLTPPTILSDLLGIPHLQEEPEAMVVVVGEFVTVVVVTPGAVVTVLVVVTGVDVVELVDVAGSE